MKILITGASGFIGKPLSKKLSELGYEVMGLTRCIPRDIDNDIYWLESDLSSSKSYKEKIELFEPEVLIHLAWQDIPDFSLRKSTKNLYQSLDFLSFISQIGSCKKILISGTCLEYGKKQGECKETDKIITKDYFTLAKHSLHLWADAITKEKSICLGWFRLFYVYGPGQREESLIPSILNKLKIGQLPEIKTPWSANDYIYIDDVIDAFTNAITTSFEHGIYNLGTGKATSVLEICEFAEKIVLNSSSLTKEIELNSKSLNSNTNFWASIGSTKDLLKWSPKITILDGIQRSWDEFR